MRDQERQLGTDSEMPANKAIKITIEDIADANRLSLSCPICASAVEDNPETAALSPVVCANCQTLYHETCWERNGNKCATLGCGHTKSYAYGSNVGPRLKIEYADLPKHVPKPAFSPNGRSKELKEQERRKQQTETQREFWGSLFRRILRAFGWR
jgi:hypothetical protein